jgi:hypothetical protein
MFLEQLTETAFEHLCSDFKLDENLLVVVSKEVAKMDLPVNRFPSFSFGEQSLVLLSNYFL